MSIRKPARTISTLACRSLPWRAFLMGSPTEQDPGEGKHREDEDGLGSDQRRSPASLFPNAKGAADYAAKVIEFSGANTSSTFDFLTHLLGMKSPSEILQLSAAQGSKHFAATAAQSRELWELTRKVASEAADPIKKALPACCRRRPILSRTFCSPPRSAEQAIPVKGAFQPVAKQLAVGTKNPGGAIWAWS